MSIERQLVRWRDAGLIDEDVRARIEAFEQSQRKPFVMYALAVLGAGTVALGIVSVVAANWDVIPGRVKLACDLVLGVGLALATYAAARREWRWPTEVLVTLFQGFTLASIALVGQVYQLGTPTYQGLLVWSAATLALVLLGHSRYLAALVVAGLATTHATSLQALFEHLERGVDYSDVTERNLLAVLLFASPLVYVPLARVPWLVRNRPEYSQTLTLLAWVAVLLFGFGLQFVWYDDVNREQTLGWSLLATAALAAGLTAALPRLYLDRPASTRHALAAILGFGWLTLALGTSFGRGDAPFVGAMLQLGWLALFAWCSVKVGLMWAFNVLTALIAVRLLVVYFEVFGSLLSTGVGLITGGGLTLAMAWLWRRKTRDLAEQLSQSARSGRDVS